MATIDKAAPCGCRLVVGEDHIAHFYPCRDPSCGELAAVSEMLRQKKPLCPQVDCRLAEEVIGREITGAEVLEALRAKAETN